MLKTNLSVDFEGYFTVEIKFFPEGINLPTWGQPIYSQVVSSHENYNQYDKPIEINAPIPEPGEYLISYYQYEGNQSYSFSTKFTKGTITHQNDFNIGKDASCVLLKNLPDLIVPLNSTINGQVGPGYIDDNFGYTQDNSDCYGFKLEEKAEIIIKFNNTLESELDNYPEDSSNAMQMDILNFSRECPQCNPIGSKSDNIYHQPVYLWMNLEPGYYGITIYAYKKFSYSITITANYEKIENGKTTASRINITTTASYNFSIILSLVILLGVIKSRRKKLKL